MCVVCFTREPATDAWPHLAKTGSAPRPNEGERRRTWINADVRGAAGPAMGLLTMA